MFLIKERKNKMIFGECPYCDSDVINYMPDKTPVYAQCTCENCNKIYWMKFSRIDSEAYTIEDFNEKYIVDTENKTINEKISTYET